MPRIKSFLFDALLALIAGQLLVYFSPNIPSIFTSWLWVLTLLPLLLLLFKKVFITKTLALYAVLILEIFTAARHQQLEENHFTKMKKHGLWRIKIHEVLCDNTFSHRYYGTILSVDSTPSSGKVLLTVQKEDHSNPLKIGQQLVTKIIPEPIPPPRNPGAFDYATYLQNKRILGQLHLNKNNHLVLWDSPFTRMDRVLGARLLAIEKIQKNGLSQTAAAHILALIFGERQYIDSELRTAYARAGLVHLLAISGLHIGIISFFIGWLLLPLHQFRGGQWIRKIILIVILWGFAILTGLQAAVVRAVTLFSLLHIGQ